MSGAAEQSPSRTAAFRSLLRNGPILRLLASYAAFAVCEYGLWIAILIYAYDHGGPTVAGIVAVAQLLPASLMALVVGPLAERRSPAVLLVTGYALQAVAVSVTAVLLFAGAPPVAVYAGAVAHSCVLTFTRPAQTALTPALATRVDQLMACNVAVGWTDNLGLLLAGVGVGVAFAVGGAGHAFAGAAVLLLGATLLLAPLRRVRTSPVGSQDDSLPVEDPAAPALLHDPPARLLVGLIGLEHVLVGALDLLFVVLAVDVLGAGDDWVGFLNTAYGAGGFVLGAAAALVVGRRLGPLIAATALVAGVALALCVMTGLAGVVLLLVLVGGSRAVFDVSVRTLLQRAIPPERVGRTFAVAEGLTMGGLALGSVLVPTLIALGGPTAALLGTAALMPVVAALRLPALLGIDVHARIPVVEMSLLRQVPLFRVLPATELESLALSLEEQTFAPGEVITREGDVGHSYYAVAEGRVDVHQRGRLIRTLERGEGFGEIALLRSVPRTATARAATTVTAYRLDRDDFLSAVTGHAPTLDSAHAVVRAHEARDAERD